MDIKTEAIVLHTLKYGDDKLVINMFTRECGRVSFIMGMPRGARPKLRRQYFQPLSQLSVEFDMRPSRNLQRLREASPSHVYSTLWAEPMKMAQAMFVADFLCKALRAEQADARVFDFVADSLQWLDGRESRHANFHVVFLMRFSLFLGFSPNLDGYRAGDWFDMRAGCFCHHAPTHNDCLAPREASLMGLMMRMNFATMHLFRLSREERNRLVGIILAYYRIHMPELGELKSLDVLRQTLEPLAQ